MRAYLRADPNLAQGLAAWERVYSVLISPRCINCHTATNYPQQGDDRRRHFANVVRGGEDGRGVPALTCAVVIRKLTLTAQACPADPIGTSRRYQCAGRTQTIVRYRARPFVGPLPIGRETTTWMDARC